jgi:hypothetical protein
MGLRATFLSDVLATVPNSDSVVDQSSDTFADLAGGKKGNGIWGRFQTGYGTSCGVIVVGWGLEAGLPPDMLNADSPGGSGFTPGAHFSRLQSGAKAHGWWNTPTTGQLPSLRPGDIYFINHGDGNNAHVGVIVSATPSADGQSLTIETADGGQGTSTDQQISRQIRTFSLASGAHPVTYSAKYSSGWLDGWISVGGSEDDGTGDPSTPASSDPSDDPPPGSDDGDDVAPVDDGSNAMLVIGASTAVLILGLAAIFARDELRDFR